MIETFRDWVLVNLINLKQDGDSFKAQCPFCKRDEGQFKVNCKTGAYNCFRASCANFGNDPAWLIKEFEGINIGEAREKYEFLQDFQNIDYKLKSIVDKYERQATFSYSDSSTPLPSSYVKCYDENRAENLRWRVPKYIAQRIKSKKVIRDYEVGFIESKVDKYHNYCVIPCYQTIDNIRTGGYVMRLMSHTEKDYTSRGTNDVLFGVDQYLKIKPKALILNEGTFDVMAMARYGYTSLGILGVQTSAGRINFLKKIAPKISRDLIIMLDSTEFEFPKKLAAELFLYYDKIKIATLKNKDPGESSHEEISSAIFNSINA